MESQVIRGSGTFLALLICISLLTFIFGMRSFDRKLRTRFVKMVIALIVAIVVTAIDEYLATFPYPVSARYVTKITKVIAEGYVEFLAILVMDVKATFRRKVAYFVPFVAFSMIYLTAPINSYVISFDAENKLVMGPLAPLAYIQGAFYATLVAIFCGKKWRNGRQKDALIIIVMLCMIILGTICEYLEFFVNSTLGTITVGVMILYMYMYAERYNVDSVTNCFKRRCFYSDGAKYAKHSMVVVSMDLNDLKYINDNYGHKAGDIALQTFANICKKCISKKYVLYRTGGDEFMMLGHKTTVDDAEQIVNAIRAELTGTPYSSSFGIAMYNYGDNFDDIVIKADQAMYADKKEFKASHTKRSVARHNDAKLEFSDMAIQKYATE